MEELKTLIEIVRDLPEMALWILAGFAMYKTFVFSSVTGAMYYGFKTLIERVHDYKTKPVNHLWSIFPGESWHITSSMKEEISVQLDRAILKINNRNPGLIDSSRFKPLIEHISKFEPPKDGE